MRNKLLKTIIATVAGMTMAIGVGAGIANNRDFKRMYAAPSETPSTSIVAGEYIITNGSKYLSGYSNNHIGLADIPNGQVVDAPTTAAFTIAASGNGWSIYQNSESKYLGWTTGGGTNYSASVDIPTSDSYLWTIALQSGSSFKISNLETSARIWGLSGSNDIRPYSNPSSGYLFSFYKIEGGSGGTGNSSSSSQTPTPTSSSSSSSQTPSSSSSNAPVTTYTVTYNPNRGSGTITDSDSPYNSGSTVTVLGSTGFTAPTGMVFDKWNTMPDGSGTDYNPDATFTISKDTILYAQWKDDPAISYTDVYSTGFESDEGFAATNIYNEEKDNQGPDGKKWKFYYGTASTNNPLSDDQSLQMRWYSTAKTNYPYSQTKFASSNIKRVAFKYKVGNKNVDFKTQYSSDGSAWTDIETIDTVSTSVVNYIKVFENEIPTFYFRIVVVDGTAPSSSNYTFHIDDISFKTQTRVAASINGDDSVNVGTEWAPTSVTEDVGGNAVEGVTFAFAASNGAVISSSNTATGAFTCSAAGTVTVSATKTLYDISNKVVTVNPIAKYINLTLNSASSAFTGQIVSISAQFGNGVTGLDWSVESGAVSGVSSSDSGYSATIKGETGTLTIRATDKTSETYSEVSVDVTETTLSLNTYSLTIAQGYSETLAVTHSADSAGGVNWSSNNAKVTVVAGVVSVALDAEVGSIATITATSSVDTSVSKTCTVTVSAHPLQDIIDYSKTSGIRGSGTGSWGDVGQVEDYTGASYTLNSMGVSSNSSAVRWNGNGYLYATVAPTGLVLKSVTVASISTNKSINVYASNTPYAAAPSGERLGVIDGNHLSYVFDGAYQYIALKGVASSTEIGAITIEYETVKDAIERQTTQSSLSYAYDDVNQTYTDVELRFGGLINKSYWDELDTDSHVIRGIGVLFSNADRIASLENINSLKDCFDAAMVQTSDIDNAITKACEDYGILYRYANISESLPAVTEENYCKWNLVKKVSSSYFDKDYVATAYIRTANDIIFLQQGHASVNALLAAEQI